MKVFSLQAPIYRGAWLSSRLTAQTSQLAAVRRDAIERWRRARSRGLSAEEAGRAGRAALLRRRRLGLPRHGGLDGFRAISAWACPHHALEAAVEGREIVEAGAG